MENKPLVSIIMPLYNAVPFLPGAIEAIRAQTFSDWEIVAVNDGSQDETKEVFSDLTVAINQPVKLINQENGGGFAARNTGLDNISGEFIALYDCDDIWNSDHLERCLHWLEAVPEVDWVYGANRLVDLTEGGKEVAASNFYRDGEPKEFLSLKNKACRPA